MEQKPHTQKLDFKSMVLKDLFSLSTRTFKTRLLRTSLTILGMSVGIGAVLFLVSLGYGLQETVLNRITTADALLSLDVSAGQSELFKLDAASIEKIASLPHVAEVSPVRAISSQIALNDVTGIVTLYSVRPSYFGLSGVVLSQGSFFTSNSGDQAARELVVSSAMTTLFNITPEAIIGKEVMMSVFVPTKTEEGVEDVMTVDFPTPFKVVGVVQDDRESFMYAPAETLVEIPVDTYIGVKVKVTQAEFMTSLRDQIIDMGFFVSVLQDTIDQVKKIFSVIQIVLGLFGLIALIVSAIGMFNTMTVLLLERTNEIGIMRSIGVTRADVGKLFIFESMIMGFLGGLGGVILGYLGGTVFNLGINILANQFGGQSISLFSRPVWFIALIIIFSTVIGFCTGIFPARRAARIKPLDALRYK